MTYLVTVDETTLVKMLELLELLEPLEPPIGLKLLGLPPGLKLLTPEQVPYSL